MRCEKIFTKKALAYASAFSVKNRANGARGEVKTQKGA